MLSLKTHEIFLLFEKKTNSFITIWTGALNVFTDGFYSVAFACDSGVRVYIAGVLIIDQWGNKVCVLFFPWPPFPILFFLLFSRCCRLQSPATFYSPLLYFDSVVFYDVNIEYFHMTGNYSYQLL